MTYLQDSKIHITNTQQVAQVFRDLLLLEDTVDRDKEHFYVMHLDTRSRINLVELVNLGTLTSSLVHPRETFRRAVMQGSASIIVAHNHPSGEADPSDEDLRVTRQLFEAGKLLGIQLLDHLIFTPTSFYSFKESRVQTMQGTNTRKGVKQ
jgi:DNA repair protein RadC